MADDDQAPVSLTPDEHIEQGDFFLRRSDWGGNTPRAASEALAAAGAHFSAATAKLLLAAQAAREVTYSLTDLANELENDEEDKG